MIVTQSREHALRYWQQLNRYIEDKGYNGLKALVAFSGDLEVDGNVWTEATANGFSETELPKKFDTDAYQVLVVAEKYQTGFDQPKLAAMYVDKKLAGLQAVQTLARLNRTHPGKTRTFVLDFQNTMEEIKEAFAPFFETTALEERTDLNQIYDLERGISNATYIDKGEGKQFCRSVLQRATLQTKTASHSKVLSVLQWDASFSMKTTRKKKSFGSCCVATRGSMPSSHRSCHSMTHG